MRAVANILCFCIFIMWLFFLWFGIDAINGVMHQNVPDYPNTGQIIAFIVIPGVIGTLLIALMVIYNFVWRSPVITITSMIFATFSLLFPMYHIMMSGGGM